MHPPKKVACFDVDGTIFRSSLLIELVEVLIQQGSFPASARQAFIDEEKKWRDRKGDYESYIDAVVGSFMLHIKNIHVRDFDKAASLVILHNHDRVYRYTRDLTQRLKSEGYFLLAISHSPKMILDKFCGEYGFDKVYGKRYVIGSDECFTGAVYDSELFMNKAVVLQHAVEKESLTLTDSLGVGDTEGDIPMLEMVAEPICFNPNATLYAHAQQKGWKVIVERKDVVYKIN